MQLLKQCLAIGLAGSFGALARFFVARHIQTRFETSFPIGTLIVNLSGCFILGFFMAYVDSRTISDTTKLAIATGFVGAYTTFSTWMYESVKLMEDGHWISVILNLTLSLLLGLVVVWLGLICGRRV